MPSTRVWSMASAALLAVTGASAQLSTPYTDANTGITYTATTDSKTGFTWGVATPSTITTDFMGFMTFPLTNGTGWGGVSLGKGGRMAGPVLVVAWPNDGQVMTTFRRATDYTNPGALTGDQSLLTVPAGTFVNETHVSVTYLCKNCIDDELTFPASANVTVMGFALAPTAPTTPSDPQSILAFHSSGFGQAGFDIPGAASADFDTWSVLATDEPGSTGGDTPLPTDPLPTDPTDPGTGDEDPLPTDPLPTDPGTGDEDPLPTDPLPTDPGTGDEDPLPTDPLPTDPTDPGTGDETPIPTDPTDPGTGDETPLPTDPLPTDPTDPGTGDETPIPDEPTTPTDPEPVPPTVPTTCVRRRTNLKKKRATLARRSSSARRA